MQKLIVQLVNMSMEMAIYVPVCFEVNDEQWEEQFFSSIDPAHSASPCNRSKKEHEIEPIHSKLRNPGEAIRNLEDVQEYLDSNSYISEATSKAYVINTEDTLLVKVSHHSTLDQFISIS